MDKEIFSKYVELKPPFDGKVLFTGVNVPLDKLRKLIETVILFLKENQLLNGKVYKVWDWFEHDGYLHPKEIISEEFLTEFIKDNEVFYQNRSGDTYVKLGLYDEFSRWYLRIYIIDEYDLKSGDELGGNLDISASEELLLSLYKYLEEKGYENIQLEDTIMHFKKIYAGS